MRPTCPECQRPAAVGHPGRQVRGELTAAAQGEGGRDQPGEAGGAVVHERLELREERAGVAADARAAPDERRRVQSDEHHAHPPKPLRPTWPVAAQG